MLKKCTAALALLLSTALLFSGCFVVERLTGGGEEQKKLVRGEWNDKAYSNSFAGLKYTLPDGWKSASDEEIANMMQMSSDSFEDQSKYLEEIAKKTTVYDMMTQDSTTGSNIIVSFENLAMSVGGTQLDEAGYLEAAKKQFDNQTTYQYSFGEPYKETVAGKEYLVLSASVADYGFNQYFYVRKIDKYMLAIIITSMQGGSDLSSILAGFSE